MSGSTPGLSLSLPDQPSLRREETGAEVEVKKPARKRKKVSPKEQAIPSVERVKEPEPAAPSQVCYAGKTYSVPPGHRLSISRKEKTVPAGGEIPERIQIVNGTGYRVPQFCKFNPVRKKNH